jgi:hypothetical protein
LSHYWESLRKKLSRDIKSPAADRAFAKIKREHAVLADFLFPADVVAHLWNGDSDYERSNRILAALLEVAQRGPEPALGRDALWLSLWPGLDAAYRRISRHRFERQVEVAAALSAAFLDLVARQRLDRVTQVAATLVRSSARDAIAALRRERGHGSDGFRTRLDLSPDDFEAAPSLEQQFTDFAEYLKALGQIEAELAVEVFVFSETRAAAGARVGLGEEASHKRLVRAVRRLRAEIELRNVRIGERQRFPLLPDDETSTQQSPRRGETDDQQHVAEDRGTREAARSTGRVLAPAAE